MAKLMAPNIRIDWYPEGHFQDIHNPTIAELNSGVNLSCAVVTGYTLDFTDSNTEDTTTIFDTFTSEDILNHSYEADLEFFLAPRGSNADNEAAYRKAEELFYNPENRVGYLAKRFGFPWNQAYDYEQPRQRVDLFKVQADLPKVVSEDGAPILLNVKYIPQGVAASGAKAGRVTYEWAGEPHASESFKRVDGNETARNYIVNSSFESELNINSFGSRTSGSRTQFISGVASGSWGLSLTVEDGANNANAYIAQSFDLSSDLHGKWVAWSLVMRRSGYGLNAVRPYVTWGSVSNTQWFTGFELNMDPLTEQTRHAYAIQVPEGATRIQIWYRFTDTPSGGQPPNGGNGHMDDWVATIADTEEAALAQVEHYFDGDTVDK